MSRVAAVVLASGASIRLGEPKQLVQLHGEGSGEMLLERAFRVASESGCAPVVVVLGCGADRIAAAAGLGDALVVFNPEWAEGMASSIRAGVRAIKKAGADGVVLMTCDQPAVTPGHLRLLCAGSNGAEQVRASEYAGRRGVPAYFPAASFDDLLALRGDGGARHLLRSAEVVALLDGELDVDTPDALAQARARFGGGGKRLRGSEP